MKKIALATALALTVGSAAAADLPSRKGPPAYVPPPPPTWTGFYVGLNLGGGWLDRYTKDGWVAGWTGFGWLPVFEFDNARRSAGGVVGGLQAGYNYQITPMFVAGLETDFQGTSISGGGGGWLGGGASRSVNWFGTVRGRLGVSVFLPELLFYGTGGFAYGDIHLNHGLAGNLSQTGTGWTAGGGVEWRFWPNWSAKVEYLYANIGASNWGGFNQWEHRVHINTVRAGVNYHFSFGPPAPVLASF